MFGIRLRRCTLSRFGDHLVYAPFLQRFLLEKQLSENGTQTSRMARWTCEVDEMFQVTYSQAEIILFE